MTNISITDYKQIIINGRIYFIRSHVLDDISINELFRVESLELMRRSDMVISETDHRFIKCRYSVKNSDELSDMIVSPEELRRSVKCLYVKEQ